MQIVSKAYLYNNWKKNSGHIYCSVFIFLFCYGPLHMAKQKQDDQIEHTYIQQLWEDTRCSPEDLPEAMNDREKWRERVRDIRASGTTWGWWWCYYTRIFLIPFNTDVILILENN